jgi:hypothetical protein
MVTADAAQVLAATVTVILAVAMVSVIVAVALAVRATRRAVRHVRERVLDPVRSIDGTGRGLGVAASSTVLSAAWWATQQTRHRMWRAVAAADHAVTSALRGRAPVGDLPTLTRRLHETTRTLDLALRASGRSGHATPEELRRDAEQVIETAGHIEASALAALGDSVHPDATELARQARIEIEALRYGLSRNPTREIGPEDLP